MKTFAEGGAPVPRSCQPLCRRSDGGGSKDCPWGHAELPNLRAKATSTREQGSNNDHLTAARKPRANTFHHSNMPGMLHLSFECLFAFPDRAIDGAESRETDCETVKCWLRRCPSE